MKQNEQHAYFSFAGDFNPTDLTVRLGLEPSRVWNKGDVNPATQRERIHSRWILDSRRPSEESLEAHVEDVLEQLRPRAQHIRSEREHTDGGLQLVGYFHTMYPGFGLDDGATSDLAAMKLGFDCDFYFLYSDDREDSD